ncbi:universal stress protein [Halobacteriales archaeon SW_12_67_38]|jgi:nucleotide-binding universal stress UspA family protein|nr:MAG: universal stress protein [Halobacteriales archaeon SW_12_67_38]PSQ64814.1 MAG: universal stress protein [Halobacteriales archaeon SW_9_67_24]
MIDSVVLATDGSASVARATAVALDLARRFGAEVHALYVVEESDVAAAPEDVRDRLREALEADGETALEDVREASGQAITTAVREGRPASEIGTHAREHDADLVAVGTRGRHGEHRFVLGSVAEAVVRNCPVPVLTVRQLDAGSA